MKTAYLTGATGCVGRNLVNELMADAWDIVILHRKSSDLSRLSGCPVRFQEVELDRLESVRAAIPTGVEVLFHVAANTSHWSAEAETVWRDNVLATRNLVAVAIERGVRRFVYTSTGATRPFEHLGEVAAARIKNVYVRTKRQGELEVYKGIERGLDAVILKPTIVVGPYDYNSYAQIFATMKTSWLKICFPGRIAFCSAVDVARAHLVAYKKGRTSEAYVLGGPYASWEEMFTLVGRAVGASRPTVLPEWLLKPAALLMGLIGRLTGKRPQITADLVDLLANDPDLTYPERRKAHIELGYESTSLEVMVRSCYDWLIREQRL